ncbi:zinc finger BED domain-containing protein RICESLEEPER 2-like isoform X2 [Wolffia australiana]
MEGTSNHEQLAMEVTPTSRRRRKRSLVWEHFTIETVSDGCTKALCKQCNQSFAYSTGKKIAGTSHLKRHITVGSCSKLRQEKRQLALMSCSKTDGNSTEPPKRRYRWRNTVSFDQDRSRMDLAKMIIMQEYPLHMVEHAAFKAFIQGLQPQFKMPDHGSIEKEILGIYQREKQSLAQFFAGIPGRVCLSIGLWTTSQTLGYVSINEHFIDNDWKLHSRLLNFSMVSSPHSENALSDVIGLCLSDWNIKSKLFTLTLDNNCSSHDIYSANLRDHLSSKNALTLKGQLFVVRCYAHLLNLAAQDVIASIHGIIYNIRESLKYVKASLVREERFAEIVQQLEIPCCRPLSLDVQSHWDTTYLMLVGALEFRHAFSYLETCDPHYNEAPSPDDWKKVETVCNYLKLLYDSANAILGAADPTANIYFHEAWKIHFELANAVSGEDSVVCGIAKEMHEKFDKYWKDCSLVLAIAVVMDPRFKMKFVEFAFSKLYGEDAGRYIKMVDDAIHALFDEYIMQPISLIPAYEDHHQGDLDNGIATPKEDHDITMVDHDHDHGANPSSAPTENLTNGEDQVAEDTSVAPAPTDAAAAAAASVADAIPSDDASAAVASEEAPTAVDAPTDNTSSADASTAAVHDAEAGNDAADIAEGVMTDEGNEVPTSIETATILDASNASNGDGIEHQEHHPSTGDRLVDFDIYISEISVTQQTKSELEQYLEEALMPRIHGFDILNWWKLNSLKYPVLSKMAQDVLAIPMLTMPTSSIFNAGNGSRLLDEYRSSLQPETVEALVCARDWLLYAPTAEAPMTSTAIVKLEQ